MVTATVLLVRHAAHVHLDRRLSGRMEGVPLSDAGHAQAHRLAARLAREPVDAVECSPLQRTRDTAAAIAGACGLDAARPVDALVEIDMGDWTGRRFDSFSADDPAWRHWNDARATARIPGGETMAEAQARIVGHLERLGGAAGDATTVLVSHSDMIRAAVAWVLGLPLGHVLRFDVQPASVSRIVVGDWGARLLSLNETDPA